MMKTLKRKINLSQARVNQKSLFTLFKLSALYFLFPTLVLAEQKYPEIRTKKFQSGKTQEITKLVAYNDVEESESFFANGKKKLTYKRTAKSKDPYEPDLYSFSEWDDAGNLVAQGTCLVSPIQNFSPTESCWTLTGIKKYWDEDGKIREEHNETKGKLDGVSTYWEPSRILKVTYKLGLKTKEETLDPKTEKVVKTVEFLEDGSRK